MAAQPHLIMVVRLVVASALFAVGASNLVSAPASGHLLTGVAGAFELVAGLYLMLGFRVHLVAAAFSIYGICAGGFISASPMGTITLLKNIAMQATLLLLAFMGAGSFSLDRILIGRTPPEPDSHGSFHY